MKHDKHHLKFSVSFLLFLLFHHIQKYIYLIMSMFHLVYIYFSLIFHSQKWPNKQTETTTTFIPGEIMKHQYFIKKNKVFSLSSLSHSHEKYIWCFGFEKRRKEKLETNDVCELKMKCNFLLPLLLFNVTLWFCYKICVVFFIVFL